MAGIKITKLPGFDSVSQPGITFKDEGEVQGTDVTSVNIVGTGHNVLLTGPNEVTIYSPEISFVSHFNTSDGNNNCNVMIFHMP